MTYTVQGLRAMLSSGNMEIGGTLHVYFARAYDSGDCDDPVPPPNRKTVA